MSTNRPLHQIYLEKLADVDPATYCPSNGYIDPTQPNDNYLILPKTTVKYGLLYNWYAAVDSRNICSIGWRVPDLTDYTTLVNYVGGNMVAGGELKESGTTYWNLPNTSATNQFLFNNRGGGNRSYADGGTFSSIRQVSNLLMTNDAGTSTTYVLNTRYSTAHVGSVGGYEIAYLLFKKDGSNIRPVKNSTTLTNGQTGFYTDPSGYVYPTICIGTQEWVSCNIKTQHYRNGDAIPEVTGNSAWAALTTGALCAYENSWDNV